MLDRKGGFTPVWFGALGYHLWFKLIILVLVSFGLSLGVVELLICRLAPVLQTFGTKSPRLAGAA